MAFKMNGWSAFSKKTNNPTNIISVKGEKEGEVPRKIKSEYDDKIYKEKRKNIKGQDVLKEKVREKGKIFGTKKYYKTDDKGNILKDSEGNPIETTKKEIKQG